MRRLLLYAFSLATLTCSLSCSSGTSTDEAQTSEAAPSVEESLKQKAAVATDAYRVQLQKDIATHEASTFTPDQLLRKARASNGYVGKKVYVEGELKRVGKDALGDSYALFKSKDRVHTVKAQLHGTALASRLTKGQKVTLSGNCLGFILSDLILDDAYEASDLSSLKNTLKNL